jgi:hypothetical protein
MLIPLIALAGLTTAAFASRGTKESFGQEAPNPADPTTNSAEELKTWAQWLKSHVVRVGLDVQAGYDRDSGKHYAKLKVTTDNPLQILEDLSSKALEIAGQNGVSLNIEGISDQPNELNFVFSTGTPPETVEEAFGAVPPPAAAAPAASVLKSAALAGPGSWTRRNVLAEGAQSSWQRRLAGTATNADFAVLRAARPGIASSLSGPISPGWSGSPWPGEPEMDEGGSVLDSIGDAVADLFGATSKADKAYERYLKLQARAQETFDRKLLKIQQALSEFPPGSANRAFEGTLSREESLLLGERSRLIWGRTQDMSPMERDQELERIETLVERFGQDASWMSEIWDFATGGIHPRPGWTYFSVNDGDIWFPRPVHLIEGQQARTGFVGGAGPSLTMGNTVHLYIAPEASKESHMGQYEVVATDGDAPTLRKL